MSFILKAPLECSISSITELLVGGESEKLYLQFSSWKQIGELNHILSHLIITRLPKFHNSKLREGVWEPEMSSVLGAKVFGDGKDGIST